jgi:hypothetical protein
MTKRWPSNQTNSLVAHTNLFKRKDYHPTLAVSDKPELILNCLKTVHCAMSAGQVMEWIREHEQIFLTFNEIKHHLRSLHSNGKVAHPNSTATRVWVFVTQQVKP